jgi:hypothetical protein
MGAASRLGFATPRGFFLKALTRPSRVGNELAPHEKPFGVIPIGWLLGEELETKRNDA